MQASLRWLYVDFNSYFASVEQEMQPRLRDKPVIVVPVETDSTCAIAASYEAKAYGIRTGTPVWEAKQKCPGLILVLANHEAYIDYHHRILAELDNHIPVTAVCSIDEAACRLMDNETAEPVARRIAMSIKRGLAANIGKHIRCSIGIAPNRYLAKVATDLQKPDGLTVLHPHDLPQSLYPLALRDLPGIGRNMEQRLHQAGIHDMQTLMGLPPARMHDIWGSIWGPRMWQLLRGADLPEIETERRTVGHSHVMAPGLRNPETAIYVARRLTLKAATRLRRMDYYATALAFSARLESGEKLRAEARCWRAQDSVTFIGMLDHMWAGTVGKTQNARLKKVSVTLHGLMPASAVQPDLLYLHGGAKQRRAETLSHAMDKLNHKYGRDTVLLGMLPLQGKTFSGTKIAFTRIPDLQEFSE